MLAKRNAGGRTGKICDNTGTFCEKCDLKMYNVMEKSPPWPHLEHDAGEEEGGRRTPKRTAKFTKIFDKRSLELTWNMMLAKRKVGANCPIMEGLCEAG